MRGARQQCHSSESRVNKRKSIRRADRIRLSTWISATVTEVYHRLGHESTDPSPAGLTFVHGKHRLIFPDPISEYEPSRATIRLHLWQRLPHLPTSVSTSRQLCGHIALPLQSLAWKFKRSSFFFQLRRPIKRRQRFALPSHERVRTLTYVETRGGAV